MSDTDDITETVEFFGAYPVCGKGGVVRSIGRDHWFCCEEHKVKWWGGSNLIHKPMTAAEVAATSRYLKDFVEVAPYHRKRTDDEQARMNYGAEIAGLMTEGHKLHVAAEAHKKECGRDQEYRHMQIRQSQIHGRQRELQRQAAQEFAALNRWRWTEHQFLVRTLARGGTHDGRWAYDELTDGRLHHCLFDHPLFFREIARPYRAVAIVVGQPYYTSTTLAEVRAIAAKIGLALHTPPELNGELVVSRLDAVLCFHAPRAGVRAIPARAIGKAGD